MNEPKLDLIAYDFKGIQAYRKFHPEEPSESSGEWVRLDELRYALNSYLVALVHKIIA